MQNPFFHRRSHNLKCRLPSLKPLSSYDQRTHITARTSCRWGYRHLLYGSRRKLLPSLPTQHISDSIIRMFLSQNKPFPAKLAIPWRKWTGSSLFFFLYRIKSSHYISNCTIAQISHETNVWPSSPFLFRSVFVLFGCNGIICDHFDGVNGFAF